MMLVLLFVVVGVPPSSATFSVPPSSATVGVPPSVTLVTVDIPGLGSVAGLPSPRYAAANRFFAIPYAKPPVGELRWASPQPHGPFASSPLDATAPGPVCYQPGTMYGPFDPAMVSPPNINPPLPMDEDCLTLNIAAPAAEPKQPLPVMVWFHGGGHSNGASSYYPIDALVNASGRGVVVVSLNYRLGVFGFLGSAELAARGGGNGTGNYGIEDQRLALRWVQEHIAAFGGDPTKVTIFGESAGGLSVLTHLATPQSYQPALYHRAIIESGVYGGAKAMAVPDPLNRSSGSPARFL